MADTGYSFTLGTGLKPPVNLSDMDYFFFGKNQSIMFDSAFLSDNAFDYFPSCQLYMSDKTGDLTDSFPFLESLEFQCSLFHSDLPDRKLSHNFYWNAWQLKQGLKFKHVAGMPIWVGISNNRKKDSIKSKSFGISSELNTGLPLSATIAKIAAPYGFSNLYIDKTLQNRDIYYQANLSDFKFLNELTKLAKSSNNSPHISFVNLKNEFYFDTLYNMLSAQADTDLQYEFKIDETSSFDLSAISNYELMFGGVSTNEEHYRKDFYYLDSKGKYQIDRKKLKDFFKAPQVQLGEIGNSSGQSLWINEDYTKKLRSVDFLGLVDNRNQKDNYTGRMNFSVINGLMSYRMDITVPFSSKAVSGKTVQIKIDDLKEQHSKMFGGKWLIYKSNHMYSRSKNTAYSMLSLLKTGLEIDASKEKLGPVSAKLKLNLPALPAI